MKVNGETCEFKNGESVAGLLNRRGDDKDRVVVELNLEILKKEQYKTVFLRDGDEVEILRFMGGG
ncbi:MAG: sulfur carrier protein ThiS [Clostridiales bacterium]|nr:sulfur carrier protein ThiS [Clostridiales bacterium]